MSTIPMKIPGMKNGTHNNKPQRFRQPTKASRRHTTEVIEAKRNDCSINLGSARKTVGSSAQVREEAKSSKAGKPRETNSTAILTAPRSVNSPMPNCLRNRRKENSDSAAVQLSGRLRH